MFIFLSYTSISLQVRELLPFADALGFSVEEYAGSRGSLPPRQRRRKSALYIATIEKVIASDLYTLLSHCAQANALVNSLIEQDRLHTLGMVVIDEVSMCVCVCALIHNILSVSVPSAAHGWRGRCTWSDS